MEQKLSETRKKYAESIQQDDQNLIKHNNKYKRPYLKRGTGMQRYNMTTKDIGKDNKDKITWKKSNPKIPSNEILKLDDKDNHVREQQTEPEFHLQITDTVNLNLAEHFKNLLDKIKLSTINTNDDKEPCWGDILKKDYSEDTEESGQISPTLLELVMKKEIAEERLFELMEKKVQNDSFTSQSSFLNKMTGNNTPSINRQYVQTNPEIIHLQPYLQNTESTISMQKETFTESNEAKDESDSNDDTESTSTETEETCHLALNKDMHTSTPNQKYFEEPKKNVIKIIVKGDDTTDDTSLTDTTLKHDDVLQKTELLKVRLQELEEQMNIFKTENENMLILKSEMENERDEFLKAKSTIEQKLNEEKILMEYRLAEEREKLAKQKSLYDRHVKEMKNGSLKKEREEIVKLKDEIIQLKEQIATKDARNGAVQSRLRTQIKQLENTNGELTSECEKWKKECNKLKNSNSRSRKLSNLRALAEINKSLAEFTLKNNMTNKHSDEECPVKIDYNIRKRTQSEPNLRVTSHYTKFFSDRDKESKAKREEMYQEPSSDEESVNESISQQNFTNSPKQRSSPSLVSCLKTKYSNSESPDCIEKVYEDTFKNNYISRELTLPDGKMEINFTNGNKKIISPDGSYDKFSYYNGDFKETFHNEGTIKYYYKESDTYRTTYKDGSEVFHYPNGSLERRYKDGSTVVQAADNSTRYASSDGSEEWTFPDGSIVSLSKNGEQTIRFPNGQVEVHASDHKRREYPDGTVKLLYVDGTTETRYANGRIRVKDKNGHLMLDSQPQTA